MSDAIGSVIFYEKQLRQEPWMRFRFLSNIILS